MLSPTLSRWPHLRRLLFRGPSPRIGTTPTEPIQLVVGFPAGQASDIGARLLAKAMADDLKQAVYVDNKPGATGIIAHQFVKNAAPDGYTVLFGSTATLAINPSLFRKLPYDPLKDFVPVAMLYASPMFLVAAPDLPVNTLAEAIAYAKANPGKATYGSGGSGSTQHISMELLKREAGIDILHVPYKGTPGMLNDLIADRVNFAFELAPRSCRTSRPSRSRCWAPAWRRGWRACPTSRPSPSRAFPASKR